MPNFRYIKEDESRCWKKEFLDKLGADSKLICVYTFDADQATNCCELTPSYDARFCGVELTAPNLGEDEYEAMLEQIQAESTPDSQDMYVHCRSVKNDKPVPCYADTLEDVIEYYQGNPGNFT